MNGYKDTELGRLPHDWDVTQLSDLVDPERTIRYGIVQPGEYEPNGRLLIRGQDYSRGWVDADDMFRVSSSVEERYINARVKTGDLIITIVGAGTGHVEEIPSWLDAANLTQTTARIAVDSKKADSKFLKHMLLSRFGRSQVLNYVKGAAQPGLNCGDVEKFALPLPVSINEQKAIGFSLNSIDEFIVSLGKLIAKKRDLKQAAMQQLLTGQKRLPGFSGAWEVRRLGSVCKIATGKKDVNEGNPAGQYPFFTCARENTYSDYFSFDCEAILVAGNGDVGSLNYYSGKFEAYQRTYVIHGFSVYAKYIWHILTFCLSASLGIGKIGSSIPYIKKTDLTDFELKIPPQEEQAAIGALLSDMDTEITALEARRNKARQLKQGMMQELLTGRIRLV